MMNGMNFGWGMSFGYGWIIGLIILAVIIWLLVKAMNQKNNPDLPKK
jgi:large-conductance mechanosensitive channel